ncbi:MAG TPA: aldo/keto reductase, partial [Geminicoccaceae bacterium]|nr:aldo/keto reductase [Geminicoccaceae bacterium]
MQATRRRFIQGAVATTAAAALQRSPVHAQEAGSATRRIPSSGEAIPAVGLGTWITFNVGDDPVLREECAAVMSAFFEAGGR